MAGSVVLCLNSLFGHSQCTVPGWASQNGGVTGGGNATPTVVSTYSDLKAALTSAAVKVVHISGAITLPFAGRISFQDQTGKTIIGLPGSRLISTDLTKDGSGILNVKRCRNIIFRNLTFEGPGAYDTDGWDNMVIDASTNIWVDHCEFQDGMDGNLDIKNASDYISVSWCKFIYNKAPIPDGPGGADDHRFSNLFGSGDGATGDRGHLRITMQNCWWAQGCKARMPRVRFGKVHIVNNLFNSTAAAQCVMAGYEADLLVESNVFENVNKPIDKMDNNFTAITCRNNSFNNTSGDTSGSGTAFTPPYTLNITPTGQVKGVVMAGAGATLISPSSCGSNDTSTPAPVTTFTLSITASPAAGGTVTGAGTYDSASVKTVTATPTSGYVFTGWSGDAAGTDTSISITMNSNKYVSANFEAQNPGDTTGTGDSTLTTRIEDDATTAQGLCSYEGAISSNSGANNGRIINLSNAAGKGVNWKVSVPADGYYTLSWRYVNSSSSNAYSMALIVNGVTVNSAQAFPKTSSSTTFMIATAPVALKAGINSIRLQSTRSTATADIDWIGITGNAPAAADCAATAMTTLMPVVSPLPLDAAVKEQPVRIYPNPGSGHAVVTVTLEQDEQALIRVYDMQGRMAVNLGTIRAVNGGTQQVPVNLNGQQPGLYYVVVTGDKGLKHTCKLIVK